MSASLVLRRRLAGELRALRLKAGMSQEDVATHLEVSSNKIVRIENAQSSVSISDLRQLLALFRADAQTAEQLLDLGRNARKRGGWWSSYRDLLPGPYIQLEAEATLVRNYQPSKVPGLLQTPDYARAVVRASSLTVPPEEVERRIAVRLKRQERLQGDNPLELHALLDEAVLHRQAGGAEVMRSQLERLIEAADLPNVSLRVLPYDAGLYPAAGNPFVILTFAGSVDPDVVLCENRVGERYFHDADEVAGFHADFRQMIEDALDETTSVTLIKKAITEMSG
ncbi:helix-turn-helix domain-containing protein [Actinoallomurus rhizosphaericola]|uniref:helix-turn-helix domain-containing protein n=1 Tax=Actinoallomurus rhizosphaericola TaxID=2952536 RepID=UPI0020921C10|nr:helix-turn-helix transcriptional regulator [Actinoallomurus rhizosphaericola]MCO5994891.1 helix-turn-helix domain-containing protein [Actinoallomurus rhizosphaericola]